MVQESPITIAYAEEQLKAWLAALEAASTGQSYSIGGRTLTRQDVPTIRAEIQRWHNTVQALKAAADGRVRAMGSAPAYAAPGTGGGGLIPQDAWERS